MFWKIYFWVCLVFTVIGVVMQVAQFQAVTWTAWISTLVFTPIFMTALGAVAFERPFLPPMAWKGMLFASVFWEVVSIGDAMPKMLSSLQPLQDRFGQGLSYGVLGFVLLLMSIFVVPPLVALYRLGYWAREEMEPEAVSVF